MLSLGVGEVDNRSVELPSDELSAASHSGS